jgi:hypothetical protein
MSTSAYAEILTAAVAAELARASVATVRRHREEYGGFYFGKQLRSERDLLFTGPHYQARAEVLCDHVEQWEAYNGRKMAESAGDALWDVAEAASDRGRKKEQKCAPKYDLDSRESRHEWTVERTRENAARGPGWAG